jgi:hypothetical protein
MRFAEPLGMDRRSGIKWSILAALGLLPVACSGSTSDGEAAGGQGHSGSHATSAGSGGVGGAAGRAGEGGAAAGEAGAGPKKPSCSSPVSDAKTGLVKCQEGYSHRSRAVACADVSDLGQGGQGGANDLPRADFTQHCDEDTECNEFYLGYCAEKGVGGATFACESGCADDADCNAGWICVCSENSTHGGVCQRSDCKTDDDCGDGYLCASFEIGCGESGFACQTAQDECASSADCEFGVCGGNVLGTVFDGPEGRRTCDDTVCGRPFLVQANARVAPVTTTQAWSCGKAKPRVDHLTTAERQALAAHWARMGQMEHASIAAFARFQLQLLALGAPCELVEACTQALGDETQHTKLCFDLASAYAGHAMGPGELDIWGSLTPTSLADVVDLVLAEGCFGETSAAITALEAADLASDPLIVAAYTQIARDEQRHAELAFRFVRWALGRDHEAVTACIVSALTGGPISSSPAVQDVVESCLCALLSRRHAA